MTVSVARNRLLGSATFRAFLLIVLLGWALEGLVQTVVPLVVLERGGNAATVGLIAAAYALPSVIFRPFVGKTIDRRGHSIIQRLGAIGLLATPVFNILPGIGTMLAARFGQGLAWSMYSTSNNVLLAVLSPRERRGEASGYYNTMRALGLVVGPPLGLWCFSVSLGLPFVAASVIGILCLGGTLYLDRRMERESPGSTRRASVAPSGAAVPTATPGAPALVDVHDVPVTAPSRHWALGLFEPTAIPSMLMIAMFMSAQTIFQVFAPVYAQLNGASLTELALFYAAFGLMYVVAPLFGGRVSDLIGRQRAIVLGTALASISLAAAIIPAGMISFAIGGMGIAIAISIVTPAVSAATIELAPSGKLGSSMATYSVGYQLASGAGGALWGVIVSLAGFVPAFVTAIGLQVLTALVARRYIAAGRAHD